jgi:hypothetical protein
VDPGVVIAELGGAPQSIDDLELRFPKGLGPLRDLFLECLQLGY